MELKSSTVVPAGAGRAVALHKGQQVRVVDVDGGQVGDVFAFSTDDPTEYLSASHTRTSTTRLFPHIGESFVTNLRRPILTLVADTSPGWHDMLIAACDPERYRALGVEGHASCADNLRNTLAQRGLPTNAVPQPINVFMRIPVEPNGTLRWLPAASRAGDAITFMAETDCLFVVSACPMDLNAINGERPTPLAIDVLSPVPAEVEM
jgi:uncharacterized protein YcgI (DUF1989 family)